MKYDALIKMAQEIYPPQDECLDNCLLIATDGDMMGIIAKMGDEEHYRQALVTAMHRSRKLGDIIIAAAGTVLSERLVASAKDKDAKKAAYEKTTKKKAS